MALQVLQFLDGNKENNMKNLSRGYKDVVVFATLIQDNLTSVHAQKNTDKKVQKNIYSEIIYKTDNLNGAIENYIRRYLEKGE
jgi:hypothetical protein